MTLLKDENNSESLFTQLLSYELLFFFFSLNQHDHFMTDKNLFSQDTIET